MFGSGSSVMSSMRAMKPSYGYTCLYDPGLGLYCYATLSDGHFTSTGVPISTSPPADQPEHLKETPDVRNTKFGAQFGGMRPYRTIEKLRQAQRSMVQTMACWRAANSTWGMCAAWQF